MNYYDLPIELDRKYLKGIIAMGLCETNTVALDDLEWHFDERTDGTKYSLAVKLVCKEDFGGYADCEIVATFGMTHDDFWALMNEKLAELEKLILKM